ATMRDGVGSQGRGCWPVARKSRSEAAKRAIAATTSTPPAPSVIERESGNGSGRTAEWRNAPTGRKPRKTSGGGNRTRAPPCGLCKEEVFTFAGEHAAQRRTAGAAVPPREAELDNGARRAPLASD